MLSVGREVCRSGLPLGFADPGQEMIFLTKGTHLKRKARMHDEWGEQCSLNIHVMVSAGHSGWSSTKVKMVDTSERPKNALKTQI
mgnify:CR=1 FL=1